MNIEDRVKRQEEIIKVIEAANNVARTQTNELKKLNDEGVCPMIEAEYSIDHVNGEPVFCFEIKSHSNGVPFDRKNISAVLITIAQAIADAYTEIGNGGTDVRLKKIRADFQKRALMFFNN